MPIRCVGRPLELLPRGHSAPLAGLWAFGWSDWLTYAAARALVHSLRRGCISMQQLQGHNGWSPSHLHSTFYGPPG